MIRIAYYRRKSDDALCVRVLRKGFACTRAELPQEIKTRCHASHVIDVELYESEAAVETIIDHMMKPPSGWKREKDA